MQPKTTQGPLGLPIGIQLYTVNAEMNQDTPSTLRKIAEIGYTEVETAGFGTLASAREFREELNRNGLSCTNAHLQFDLNNLNKAFDDAHALGALYATTSVPRMLLWPVVDVVYTLTQEEMTELFTKVFAPMPMDEYKRTVEALNKVGEAARSAGLKFAAHNHMMEMEPVGEETGLDYLIRNTNADDVKFELDCGWATMMGRDAAGFVERHPGRITLLHAKDFKPYEGDEVPSFSTVKGMELGRGMMNYPRLFSRLQGKGIEHLYVEQDGPFDRMPAIESARVDYEFLKTIA